MQVNALRKAMTEDDDKRAKEEGRCFHCNQQGHIKWNCAKWKEECLGPRTPSDNPRPCPGQAAKTTTTELELNADSVMKFLKGLNEEEYQDLTKKWGEETGDEGFGQA